MTEYTTNFIIDKEEFYEMAEKDYKDWIIERLEKIEKFETDNQPELNFMDDQNERLKRWELNHKEAVYTARYFYEQFKDMHELWMKEYYKNNSKEVQKLPF